MIQINRTLVDVLINRIKESDPLIQVLVGPRQIGKTTIVKEVIKDKGLYKTADYPNPLNSDVLEEWWNELNNSNYEILVIDEIQKINNWSDVLKKLWDASNGKKIIITGSSALLVQKGLKETLMGRYELIKAEHWNFEEAKKILKLNINNYIEFGCYPGSIRFLTNIDRWGDYIRDSIVEPAIGRDLLQLHPVEQPALLRQIFGVAVSLPAQIISLQKIQGQLQSSSSISTIQNYLKLLGEASLVSAIEKYSEKTFRRKKSSPKLIVNDNALIRAFERPISNGIDKEKLGRYFENIVGARFIEAGWDVYYWKDRQLEVDYIVQGPNGENLAIEVKTSKINENDLKGLKYFTKIYPNFKPCLVSLINQKIEGVISIEAAAVLSICKKY
jgi:uncharacterized protein